MNLIQTRTCRHVHPPVEPGEFPGERELECGGKGSTLALTIQGLALREEQARGTLSLLPP